MLARLIVDDGWPIARAAEHFNVSWPTAKRWATRYVEMGPDGMGDRSSRPHHSPNRTPEPTKRKIVHLRWRKRALRSWWGRGVVRPGAVSVIEKGLAPL